MPENQPTVPDYTKFYIPAAIVVAGVFVGGSLFFALSGHSGGAGATLPAPAVNVKDVKVTGEPYVGNQNAPLTMAYWSDYQCPFCKQFETTVLPALMTKYVNTGKLKIVFKDFAFLGNDSTTGAEYARAVWDLYPSKFFLWRQAMFKAQDQEGDVGFGNAASIDQLDATISGIDAAKVKARVATKKSQYDTAIAADQSEGASFGIQGTPGFIVGNKAIDGAQPLSSFESVIDPQLK